MKQNALSRQVWAATVARYPQKVVCRDLVLETADPAAKRDRSKGPLVQEPQQAAGTVGRGGIGVRPYLEQPGVAVWTPGGWRLSENAAYTRNLEAERIWAVRNIDVTFCLQ